MMLSTLVLFVVLYFLGSIIVFIPSAILVSVYGSTGWLLTIGLLTAGIALLAYRGYRQTLANVLANAEEVTPDTYPALSETLEVLEREAVDRGMEPPTLYVHPDPAVNALAIGRRNNGHIVIFDGLLTELDDMDELNAIVGHELAHLNNRDSVLMATLSGIKEMVVRSWTWIGFTLRQAIYQRRGVVLGPNEETMLKRKMRRRSETISSPIGLCEKSISRHREYIADAEGARVASPEAMVGALETIGEADRETRDMEFSQSLCIHGPRGGFLSRLRSTHPPLKKRIRYVQKTAA